MVCRKLRDSNICDTNVHFLFPIPLSIAEAKYHHLASVRLRLAVAWSALEDFGFRVSIGEILPADVKLVVVPKIGSDDIDRRSVRWLATIFDARKLGARIILDYTDHHLGFDSPMRRFYQFAIQMCDLCVVPSTHLKRVLSVPQAANIIEIRDALEYSIISPRSQAGTPPVVLWFGHGSNFGYLVDFLNKNDLDKHCASLVVVSSKDVLNWVYENRRSIDIANLEAIEWSVESLLRAAVRSDISLLPLGLTDPRKSGASSNRLITSLALGLPVITQSIASYSEYRYFYTDLDEDNFIFTLSNPTHEHGSVIRAQREILPSYDPKIIGELWVSAVQSLVELNR